MFVVGLLGGVMVVEGKQTKLESSVLMSDTWESRRLRTDPFPGEYYHRQRLLDSLHNFGGTTVDARRRIGVSQATGFNIHRQRPNCR